MGRRHVALALLLLVPAAVMKLPVARADDWSVARGDFREDMREPDWKVRRSAFLSLLDWDGPDALREVLKAALQEKNGAVVLEGIKTLGGFQTPEAQAALLDELAHARGEKAILLLMALAEQKGPSGVDALMALLHGKDAQQAALAALALGEKKASKALPHLLDLLDHKEWQVASAAARAVREMAWSDWTEPDKKKGVPKKPKMPAWFDVAKARDALIAALGKAEGPARGDVIRTLEYITNMDFGDNPAAWAAYAKGEEVPPAILRKRVRPPYLMGVPVWGRRVVVVKGINVNTETAHPFKDRARLQELCAVPGGRDLAWFRIKTIRDFNDAWVTRFIQDLPTRDTRFELVFSGVQPREAFGKLKPVNGGTKGQAIEEVEKAPVQNQNDVLAAMTYALDVSGSKESVAWRKGPDVVCCIYSSIPWKAAVTDTEIIGATLGLKARRRLVKIHAIGVGTFAYGMMRQLAEQTGGVYLELSR